MNYCSRYEVSNKLILARQLGGWWPKIKWFLFLHAENSPHKWSIAVSRVHNFQSYRIFQNVCFWTLELFSFCSKYTSFSTFLVWKDNVYGWPHSGWTSIANMHAVLLNSTLYRYNVPKPLKHNLIPLNGVIVIGCEGTQRWMTPSCSQIIARQLRFLI